MSNRFSEPCQACAQQVQRPQGGRPPSFPLHVYRPLLLCGIETTRPEHLARPENVRAVVAAAQRRSRLVNTPQHVQQGKSNSCRNQSAIKAYVRSCRRPAAAPPKEPPPASQPGVSPSLWVSLSGRALLSRACTVQSPSLPDALPPARSSTRAPPPPCPKQPPLPAAALPDKPIAARAQGLVGYVRGSGSGGAGQEGGGRRLPVGSSLLAAGRLGHHKGRPVEAGDVYLNVLLPRDGPQVLLDHLLGHADDVVALPVLQRSTAQRGTAGGGSVLAGWVGRASHC